MSYKTNYLALLLMSYQSIVIKSFIQIKDLASADIDFRQNSFIWHGIPDMAPQQSPDCPP
jgi:hypothetical protein